jgi:lipoate-protein ligase A
MIKKSVYKIPEGKLVKIELETEKERIKKIKITGDFFLYPEEIINKLEENLVGCKINKKILIKHLDNFWKINRVDCFGINSSGLAEAILIAEEKI